MFFRRILPVGLLALVVLGLALRPDRLLRIATGAVSQNVCSQSFVSRLDAEAAYREDLRDEPGMALVDWAMRRRVDHGARKITTTILGGFETTSTFHAGYGCRLEHAGAAPLEPVPAAARAPAVPLPLALDEKLESALDAAFASTEGGDPRYTRAIVVVHHGKIVAERYAAGFGVDTPFLSHSLAKSVTNALVGILVRDGALSVEQSVSSPGWTAPVTVDQLLRMTSGLPLDEGLGPGLAQRMWFVEPDGDAFARATALATKPGEKWAYGNLGYAVLSRLVRDAAGGAPTSVVSFARRELFEPVGMSSATIEFDGAGTPMGGNAMFATAREWARFGLLYLHDGRVGERRILPEGWVAYSTKPTLDTGYGAGFWLNVTDAPIPVWKARWGMPGAPKDAFFARGYLGQFLVIVPSEDLVIVRLGTTRAQGGGIEGMGELVRQVVGIRGAR